MMIRPHRQAQIPSDWDTPEELFAVAAARMRHGLAPSAEIYQIQHRTRFNWSDFPDWAAAGRSGSLRRLLSRGIDSC